ncbi:MAG: 5'-deoxynucleotidase [Deltaproteobacteria bacterium]|nr:5'-deoxynucleotidase [Deltaproteobacteria bacterium]
MSHFFAYLARMRFVKRWGLMRNTHVESLQEHSLQVAMLAHALAVIRNTRFGGSVRPERAATLALYHDAAEVITGDVVAPIKHFNPEIRAAHGVIEKVANERLKSMLPAELAPSFTALLFPAEADAAEWALVKAADKLTAYLKCLEEIRAGNDDFRKAAQVLERDVRALVAPEVRYFLDTFAPSFSMTLDELNQ